MKSELSPSAAAVSRRPAAARGPIDRSLPLRQVALERATRLAAADMVVSGAPLPAVLLLKEPGRLLGAAYKCFETKRTLLRVCPQAPFSFEAVPAAFYARVGDPSGPLRSLLKDWDSLEVALIDSADSLREWHNLAEEEDEDSPELLNDLRKLVAMGESPQLGWRIGLPKHLIVRLAESASILGADLVVWPTHGGLRPLVHLPPAY